jgi:hypothetical protein
MPALRLAMFAALCGVALWGLFSLLDTLREPQLLRSSNAAVVKGCEPAESQQARQLCPQLFCQKALIDAGGVPRLATFEVHLDGHSGAEQIIAGVAHSQSPGGPWHFACTFSGGRVSSAELIDAAQLQTLTTGAQAQD